VIKIALKKADFFWQLEPIKMVNFLVLELLLKHMTCQNLH